MKRWSILASVILCLGLLGATACRSSSEDGTGFSGQLEEVVRGDLIVSVSGNGMIDVADDVSLSFDNGGEVAGVYVRQGETVKAGQTLAVLMPLDMDTLSLMAIQAEIALMQAEYNLDQAAHPFTDEEIEDAEDAVDDAECYLDLANDMLGYVLHHGSEAEVHQWKMEVFNAEVQLEMAEDTLEDMLDLDEDQIAILEMQVYAAAQTLAGAQEDLETENLTAPFDGIVADVYIDDGDVVPPSSASQIPAVHLIDATRMELVVQLDEIDIPDVRVGQKAIVTVDALPDLELEGEVTSIYPLPTIDVGLVQYQVEIGFSVPEGSGLRAGMSTTADIILNGRSGVLLVPERSLDTDAQGNTIVWVVTTGSEGMQQIEERPVVTGLSDGFQAEIISGLSEGEVIIVGIPDDSRIESASSLFFGSD